MTTMAKSFEEREREFFGDEYDLVQQDTQAVKPAAKRKKAKAKRSKVLTRKSQEALRQLADEEELPTDYRARASLHPDDVDALLGFGREDLHSDLAYIKRRQFSVADW